MLSYRVALFAFAVFILLTFYRKVEKGTALVRIGLGGTKVYFNGGTVGLVSRSF
jgi:hypothetical protein